MSIHLGGSSRQSLEAGRAALDKVISGANADSLSKLSQDLFVVVNGLGTSIALRRAVTDPARNDADKNALFMAARRLAYGDSYGPVSIKCPKCYEENKHTINLGEITEKPYEFDKFEKGKNLSQLSGMICAFE